MGTHLQRPCHGSYPSLKPLGVPSAPTGMLAAWRLYDMDILEPSPLADGIEMTSACLIRVQSVCVLVTTLPSRELQESRASSTPACASYKFVDYSNQDSFTTRLPH
jgi:hypothetical protein